MHEMIGKRDIFSLDFCGPRFYDCFRKLEWYKTQVFLNADGKEFRLHETGRLTCSILFRWHLHYYEEAAGLDTISFIMGLARSTTNGSVSLVHRTVTYFGFEP